MPVDNLISCEGDFEAVILHEAQEALAALVGPTFYRVLSSENYEEVRFHTPQAFDLFLIHLVELVVERPVPLSVNSFRNTSFLPGLEWFCRHQTPECDRVGLSAAVQTFRAWINQSIDFVNWCPDVNLTMRLRLSRQRLIDLAGNLAKHSLLRIDSLLAKLDSDCQIAGHQFSTPDLAAIMLAIEEPLRNRLRAYGTYLIEMIGAILVSLNRLLHERYVKNPTNDCRKVIPPTGVTSPLYLQLYTRVLMNANGVHESGFFSRHIPRTPDPLRDLAWVTRIGTDPVRQTSTIPFEMLTHSGLGPTDLFASIGHIERGIRNHFEVRQEAIWGQLGP